MSANKQTLDHKLKISLSNFNRKNNLTKDVYDKIHSLKESGLTQKQIGIDLDLSRSVIYKVLSNKMIPVDFSQKEKEEFLKERYEIKQQKVDLKTSMTPEEYQLYLNKQISLKKMKLTPEQIVEILNYKNYMKTNKHNKQVYIASPEIVDIFSKKGIYVSETMIKNYWSGKTKLDEDFF